MVTLLFIVIGITLLSGGVKLMASGGCGLLIGFVAIVIAIACIQAVL